MYNLYSSYHNSAALKRGVSLQIVYFGTVTQQSINQLYGSLFFSFLFLAEMERKYLMQEKKVNYNAGVG